MTDCMICNINHIYVSVQYLGKFMKDTDYKQPEGISKHMFYSKFIF